jgi:hypothetical protein
MPPAIGYSGLSAVIITCGTEKAPHSAQPAAHIIGYPFKADSLGDFHQVTAGEPSPLPVGDCDSGAGFLQRHDGFRLSLRRGALRAVTGSFGGAPKWTDQAQISGNPVNDGPSLAVLKNTFYCAYTTHDGSAVIQSSGDGKHWSAPANTPARPVHGPALSTDPRGEQLRLVYVQSGATRIYTTVSSDGTHWSEPAEHPDALSSAAPALIASAAGLMLCV